MTEYFTPAGHGEGELLEKRSRFLGQVWRVDSEEEARARIEQTRRRFHDARHNCWCYLIREGPVRYSDDGEPQGTAGQPMLNVFQREGVENVCCVVTRYFGGILLGAGGLVRAYTQSAKDALDKAGISVVRRWAEVQVDCTYAQMERLTLETAQLGGTVTDTQYGAEVTLSVLLPQGAQEGYFQRLKELTAGSVRARETGTRLVDVPISKIR